MSIGNRLDEDELSDATVGELYSILGQNDTPFLFEQPYRLDVDHDVSTAGANSVDRKTVYIDRTLYREVMEGKYNRTGLTPKQIITLWCEHEHTEKCIVDGDNPVDQYYPAHKRGLRREHGGLLIILGQDRGKQKIENYEEVIWPGIMAAYHRPVLRPPADLWCGPLLDEPTQRDREIIEALERLDVRDANKHSKKDVSYGFAHHRCDACRMWDPDRLSQERRRLAACKAVNGLVRDDRGCDLWMPAKATSARAA